MSVRRRSSFVTTEARALSANAPASATDRATSSSANIDASLIGDSPVSSASVPIDSRHDIGEYQGLGNPDQVCSQQERYRDGRDAAGKYPEAIGHEDSAFGSRKRSTKANRCGRR